MAAHPTPTRITLTTPCLTELRQMAHADHRSLTNFATHVLEQYVAASVRPEDDLPSEINAPGAGNPATTQEDVR